jgi:acyl-CoA synthetase (AMP-forming)/AMP-acid ligase II
MSMPRGKAMATLKAGGAYVPLDPNYPTERLAFMLADSAPRVLLTQAAVRAALTGLPPSLVVLELDASARSWEALIDTNPQPTALQLEPSHLAYVIYTSGSTGQPKGVTVEHRSVVNFLGSMLRLTGIGPQDRLLAVTTLAFDIAWSCSCLCRAELASSSPITPPCWTLFAWPTACKRCPSPRCRPRQPCGACFSTVVGAACLI